MKTSSRKQKGHALEKIIRERLIEAFNLDEGDVRIPISGESGADIKLTPRAKRWVPFQFEAKNHEKFLTIYNYYQQAVNHRDGLVPCLVIKMNRRQPLAILDLDHLLTLIAAKGIADES